MTEKEIIEVGNSKIWLGEDGVIRQIVLPNSEITLDDVKEHLKIASKLANNKIVPLLVDTRGIKSMDREARLYIQKEAKKIVSMVAILIGSPVSRLIGNLFLGINKTPYPTKLFTSEDKAIEWLKGFIKKTNDEGKK